MIRSAEHLVERPFLYTAVIWMNLPVRLKTAMTTQLCKKGKRGKKYRRKTILLEVWGLSLLQLWGSQG